MSTAITNTQNEEETPKNTFDKLRENMDSDDTMRFALEEDLQQEIESLVSSTGCKNIYFCGPVDIMYGDDITIKQRQLIQSGFRIYLLRQGALGRTAKQSYQQQNQNSIRVHQNQNALQLTFNDDVEAKQYDNTICSGQLTINHPKIKYLVRSILLCTSCIRYGYEPFNLEIPQKWVDDLLIPSPNIQDGQLALYIAECNRLNITQNENVQNYMMSCFQTEDRIFAQNTAFGFTENVSTRDIYAITLTLKYTKWFEGQICVNYPTRNESGNVLSTIFSPNTIIHTLVLINCKQSRHGFQQICNGIRDSKACLERLIVSKNDLGDSSIEYLMECLKDLPKVPTIISLNQCNIGIKGAKILFNTQCLPLWSNTTRSLDVSNNPIGKSGTEVLSKWQLHVQILEQQILSYTDTDLDRLFYNLSNNDIVHTTLNVLDVSGNRLQSKAVVNLCRILENTNSLTNVILSNCRLDIDCQLKIFDSILNNRNNISFVLDVSNNAFGLKGAKKIENYFLRRKQTNTLDTYYDGVIQSLNLSKNNFGNEGQTIICRTFENSPLKTQILDQNFRTSILSTRGDECSQALVSLVQNSPNLQELSIAGDGGSYILGKYLYPQQQILGNNTTKLIKQNISNNRLNDEGISQLANSLNTNRYLRHINFDNSHFTLDGLILLEESLRNNTSITHIVTTNSDIHRQLSENSKSQTKIAEIYTQMESIDTYLYRNEKFFNEINDTNSRTTIKKDDITATATATNKLSKVDEDIQLPESPSPSSSKSQTITNDIESNENNALKNTTINRQRKRPAKRYSIVDGTYTELLQSVDSNVKNTGQLSQPTQNILTLDKINPDESTVQPESSENRNTNKSEKLLDNIEPIKPQDGIRLELGEPKNEYDSNETTFENSSNIYTTPYIDDTSSKDNIINQDIKIPDILNFEDNDDGSTHSNNN